jgi:hypothetical protein
MGRVLIGEWCVGLNAVFHATNEVCGTLVASSGEVERIRSQTRRNGTRGVVLVKPERNSSYRIRSTLLAGAPITRPPSTTRISVFVVIGAIARVRLRANLFARAARGNDKACNHQPEHHFHLDTS